MKMRRPKEESARRATYRESHEAEKVPLDREDGARMRGGVGCDRGTGERGTPWASASACTDRMRCGARALAT